MKTAPSLEETADPAPAPRHLLYLDGLRVVATLAVISIHASSEYSPELPIDSDAWWAQAIFQTITRWCVPLFVMISGATLLDPARQNSPRAFYRRRASRVLVPLLFWMVACNVAMQLSSHPPTISSIVSSILHDAGFYHLYFLAIMLGLYLATPLLRILCRQLSASTQRTAAFTLAILIALAQLVRACYGEPWTLNIFNLWMPYIGYFLIGYAIRDWIPTGARLVAISLAFVAWQLGTLALGRSLSMHGADPALFTQNFLSPLVLVGSVLAYLTFAGIFSLSNRAPLRWLNSSSLGAATFGIYLMHVLFLNHRLTVLPLHPVLKIPVLTVMVFLLSFAIVLVIRRIPGLARVVGE